ncbi:hypothetical protein M433DRAFT_460574 [Acidomyces richmondensis BFW]|nr:hypothetical protein M433DRAFT_460574 [Acidomyces richmondensis BFW]
MEVDTHGASPESTATCAAPESRIHDRMLLMFHCQPTCLTSCCHMSQMVSSAAHRAAHVEFDRIMRSYTHAGLISSARARSGGGLHVIERAQNAKKLAVLLSSQAPFLSMSPSTRLVEYMIFEFLMVYYRYTVCFASFPKILTVLSFQRSQRHHCEVRVYNYYFKQPPAPPPTTRVALCLLH